jgi:hypothetical protein
MKWQKSTYNYHIGLLVHEELEKLAVRQLTAFETARPQG